MDILSARQPIRSQTSQQQFGVKEVAANTNKEGRLPSLDKVTTTSTKPIACVIRINQQLDTRQSIITNIRIKMKDRNRRSYSSSSSSRRKRPRCEEDLSEREESPQNRPVCTSSWPVSGQPYMLVLRDFSYLTTKSTFLCRQRQIIRFATNNGYFVLTRRLRRSTGKGMIGSMATMTSQYITSRTN